MVRPGRQPAAGDEIFIGDGYRDNTVSLEWQGPKLLQITVPISATVLDQKAIHREIAIEIKFHPDDPVAREKILQEREERRVRRDSE